MNTEYLKSLLEGSNSKILHFKTYTDNTIKAMVEDLTNHSIWYITYIVNNNTINILNGYKDKY